MPRGDGSGPAGMGPMTGRAAGYCAGYGAPGYLNPRGGQPANGRPAAYRAQWDPGGYPAAPYGWGGYPVYGRFPPLGRGSRYGLGFGRGRARGRGRGRGW